jgi:hypothetical protein
MGQMMAGVLLADCLPMSFAEFHEQTSRPYHLAGQGSTDQEDTASQGLEEEALATRQFAVCPLVGLGARSPAQKVMDTAGWLHRVDRRGD